METNWVYDMNKLVCVVVMTTSNDPKSTATQSKYRCTEFHQTQTAKLKKLSNHQQHNRQLPGREPLPADYS